MNKLLEAYLELALKDRQLTMVSYELADEITKQIIPDDGVILTYLENNVELTTIDKQKQYAFLSDKEARLCRQKAIDKEISEKIFDLSNVTALGNVEMHAAIAKIIRTQKPNSFVSKLDLNHDALVYFKNTTYTN
jgi:hypothetical protein